MDAKVKVALDAVIRVYAESEQTVTDVIIPGLTQVFVSEKPFIDKIEEMDRVFDEQPQFEEVREYVFDLLLINFFAADVEKLEADYLESAEWEAIEEQTLDRGSELLNILLYLRECADDEVEPSLHDFLTEFLLVEEDEFQDEHRIYEKVIANQILIESSYQEIARVAETYEQDEELTELFYPVVSFFTDTTPDQQQLADYTAHASNKSLDLALLQLMINFNA